MDKRLLLIFILIFFCSLSYVYASSDENITIEDNNMNIKDFHELNVYNDEYYVNYFKNDNIFENNSQQQDFSKNNSISKSYNNNETFEKIKGNSKVKNRDLINNVNNVSLPVVWSNCSSDLYSSSFHVKLSAWDAIDENPIIYYTCDGSNPINNGVIYNNPILISGTTSLKFCSLNSNGDYSEIKVCNYIFSNIGNLNSGKGFGNIQTAIDDSDTRDGDTIKVGACYYKVNLVINKSINLISTCGNSILSAYAGAFPVIQVNANGSDSVISGFHIQYSNYGIKLINTANVGIINNEIEHCKNCIVCDCDDNTVIANNYIFSWSFVSAVCGIKSIKSDNLYIRDNVIELVSDNQASGISLLNETVENITVVNNKISNTGNNRGVGIYACSPKSFFENNSISNFNLGIYVCTIHSVFYNNKIFDNNIGFDFIVSANNTFESNNIHENLFGVYLSEELLTAIDSFYLNRLTDNENFDFFSDSNTPYSINHNWWGLNNPNVSNDYQNFSNIYNSTGNLILTSWVRINVFAGSFTVDENSNILRTKIYVEANYNNNFQDLSVIGFIPNGIKTVISCFNNHGTNITGICYLKDGLSFVDFDVEELFLSSDNIIINATFDNENISVILNKKATIDIQLFSTAIDTSTGNTVNYNLSIDYNDINWISFAWAETGLFTGTIHVIVNGEIVKSINITNYHNNLQTMPPTVLNAIKLYNTVFASSKKGVWAPNGYYLDFANQYSLDITRPDVVSNKFLQWLENTYHFPYQLMDYIFREHDKYVDTISMGINYHGDLAPIVGFKHDEVYKRLKLPSSAAIRTSHIYYDNILDENDLSIGYEGMRSFAIVKSNVTDDSLRYWLNQKENYNPGLMKAAYGTFLTSLLVIYENDRVADDAAEKFNVTWNRISPVCVSLCNDFNCLYITGESDHLMGREAIGNSSSVWNFNFATSFSFSLVEQLVGNNVWNTTVIGSVTLGLIESYINNETLEIFTSDGYTFIKRAGDNSTLLFLDMETGIVRDIFSFYGLLGTMPCYHDNITENAWKYGNNLLNQSSTENAELTNVSMFSQNSSELINEINRLLKVFDGFDWNNFLLTFGSGVVGSELLSIGAVLFIAGIAITCPEIIIAGTLFFILGEIFLAYSDGLIDGEVTLTDGFFFTFDNVISILLPFIGIEIEIGSQFSKTALESIILKYQNKILEEISSQLIVENIPYFVFKIVLKDQYSDPIKIQLERFFLMNIVPMPYRERFKRIVDYYWEAYFC